MTLKKVFVAMIALVLFVTGSTVLLIYMNNLVPKKAPVRARQVYFRIEQMPKYYLAAKGHNVCKGVQTINTIVINI